MARSKAPKPPATQTSKAPEGRKQGVIPFSSLPKEEQEQYLREHTKPLSVAMADQARNFFVTVGMGISHWAAMETRLVQVVAKLLRAPQERVGLVMYSIININIWLQIIEDLFVVDGTYPRSLRLWRKISESIRKENAIRVRLAHQSMSQERIEQEGELYGVQAFLRPARLDTRIQSQKYKPLPMMEILDFVHRVNAIHDRLIELLAVMKKRKSLR